MRILPAYLRPDSGEYPPYYDGYFGALPEADLFELLVDQPAALRALMGKLSTEGELFRYAEGKWSAREVVGHIVDTERIFSYRAMRILREDATPLPGYEQNEYVQSGRFESRRMGSLLDEFKALRRANVILLGGLEPEVYRREGTASGHRISLRAIVCVLAAHVEHHLNILRERYVEGAKG